MNRIVISIFFAFFITSYSCAMLRHANPDQDSKSLTIYTDAAKFQEKVQEMKSSMQEIAYVFKELSPSNQRYFIKRFSQAPLFSVSILPQEIRITILKEILDHDEESAKHFDAMSLQEAFAQYECVKKCGPLKIGNKLLSVGRLFRLAASKREFLKQLNTPSLYERFIGKTTGRVFSGDVEKVAAMPADILSELDLKVIDPDYIGSFSLLTTMHFSLECILWMCAGFSPLCIYGLCCGGGSFYVHRYLVDKNTIQVKL